jgi:hypothetical protein
LGYTLSIFSQTPLVALGRGNFEYMLKIGDFRKSKRKVDNKENTHVQEEQRNKEINYFNKDFVHIFVST